jgi:hypothetical protein
LPPCGSMVYPIIPSRHFWQLIGNARDEASGED